jgi:membrane protein
MLPTLLIIIGMATSVIGSRSNPSDVISDFTSLLPLGSRTVVADFLIRRSQQAWKWVLIGWIGTLLTGTQIMKLLVEGIHIIYGDQGRPGFVQRQLRGLYLLLLTIVPLLAAAILGVFGEPLRQWAAREFGQHGSVQIIWGVFFHGTAIVLGTVALTIIYRVARPQENSVRKVLPGAIFATLLWWFADVLFGFYVRKVPYGIVYGGLAAAIGLLIWMQLSTLIIFLGAAFNAELAQSRG